MANKIRAAKIRDREDDIVSPATATPEPQKNDRVSSVVPSAPTVNTGHQSKVSKNAIYTDPIKAVAREKNDMTGRVKEPTTGTKKQSKWTMNSTKYRMPNIDVGTSLTGLSSADAWNRMNSRAFMYANSTGMERDAHAQVFKSMWDAYQIGQDSPGSAFYNPYRQPTNKAYAALAEMGIDATRLSTQDLLGMVDSARYTQTGHTPAAPTTKSTAEENMAYWAYQILTNQDRTQKAVNELEDVKRRINWYAQQGLSDSEIKDRIQAEYDKGTFSTLRTMDNDRTTGTATVLNQAIDWMGMDSVEGMIWSARNGGQSTGNSIMDAGIARHGLGERYRANAEAEAMRDRSNLETYHPYYSGTTLEDEALQFGVASFDDKWLAANRSMLNGSDADRKAYNNIQKAVNNSNAAQTELTALNEWAQAQIAKGKTFEQIQEAMQDSKFWNDYKTLQKMESERASGGALEMGYAVDFSLPRWQEQLQKQMSAPEAEAMPSVTEYTANAISATRLHNDVKRYFQGYGPRTAYGEHFMEEYSFLFPSSKDVGQHLVNTRGYTQNGLMQEDVLGQAARGILNAVDKAAADDILSADDLAEVYVMTAQAMEKASAAGMDLQAWITGGHAPDLQGITGLIEERRQMMDEDRTAQKNAYNRAMATEFGTAYDAVMNGDATDEQQGYYAYLQRANATSRDTMYDPDVANDAYYYLYENYTAAFGADPENYGDTDALVTVSRAIAARAKDIEAKPRWIANAMGLSLDEYYELFPGERMGQAALLEQATNEYFQQWTTVGKDLLSEAQFAMSGQFGPRAPISREAIISDMAAGAESLNADIESRQADFEEEDEPTEMEERYGGDVGKWNALKWSAMRGIDSAFSSQAAALVYYTTGNSDIELQALRAKFGNDPQLYRATVEEWVNSNRFADPQQAAYAEYMLQNYEGDIFNLGLLSETQDLENYIYSAQKRIADTQQYIDEHGTAMECGIYNTGVNVVSNSVYMAESGLLAALGTPGMAATTLVYGLPEGAEMGKYFEDFGMESGTAKVASLFWAAAVGKLEQIQMEKYLPDVSRGWDSFMKSGLGKVGEAHLPGLMTWLGKVPGNMLEEGAQELTEYAVGNLYQGFLEGSYKAFMEGDTSTLTSMLATDANAILAGFGSAVGNLDARDAWESFKGGAVMSIFLGLEGASIEAGYRAVLSRIAQTNPDSVVLQAEAAREEIMKDPENATFEQIREAAILQAEAMQDPEYQEALRQAAESAISAESVVSQVSAGALDDLLAGKEAVARQDAKANLDRATEQRDRDAEQVRNLTEALSSLTAQIQQAEVVTPEMAQQVNTARTELEQAAEQAETSSQAYDDAQVEYDQRNAEFSAIMKQRFAEMRERAQSERQAASKPRTPSTSFAAQAASAEARAAISGTTLDKARAHQARAAANIATFTDELNNGRIKPSVLRTQSLRFAGLRADLEAANAEVQAEETADVQRRYPAQARLQQNIDTIREAAFGSEEYNRATADAEVAGAESKVIQAEREVEQTRAGLTEDPLTLQAYQEAQSKLTAVQENLEAARKHANIQTKARVVQALYDAGQTEVADALKSKDVNEIADVLQDAYRKKRISIRAAAEAAGIDWRSNEFRPAAAETLETLDAARTGKAGLTDATTNKSKVAPETRAQKRVLNALGKKYGFEVVMVDSLEGRFNGMYRGGRTVYVAADSVEGALVQTGMHEAVHMVKAQNPESYKFLEAAVEEALGEDFDWEARKMALMQGTEMTEEEATEEIVAEATAAVFADKTALQSILKKDGGTTLRRIADALRGFWENLKEIVKRYAGAQNNPEIQRILDAGQQQMNAVAGAMNRALGGIQTNEEIAQYDGYDIAPLDLSNVEEQRAPMQTTARGTLQESMIDGDDIVAVDTSSEPMTLEDGTKVATDAQALGMAQTEDGSPLLDVQAEPDVEMTEEEVEKAIAAEPAPETPAKPTIWEKRRAAETAERERQTSIVKESGPRALARDLYARRTKKALKEQLRMFSSERQEYRETGTLLEDSVNGYKSSKWDTSYWLIAADGTEYNLNAYDSLDEWNAVKLKDIVYVFCQGPDGISDSLGLDDAAFGEDDDSELRSAYEDVINVLFQTKWGIQHMATMGGEAALGLAPGEEAPKYSRRSMVGYQTDGSVELDPETGYYMNGDLVKIRAELGKRVGTSQQIMTQEEIDKLTNAIQAVVDYIDEHQAFRMVLDHNWDLNNENRPFLPIKENSDPHYKAAGDFSTLCRKRVVLQMIAEDIATRIGRAVTKEEGIVLRKYLQGLQEELKTLEVACGLCYVEAARTNSIQYQNEFLNNREYAVRSYFAQKDKKWKRNVLGAAQNKFRADNNIEQRGERANKKDMPPALRTEYEEMSRRMRQERQLTEQEQRELEYVLQMDPAAFLTMDGLRNLKMKAPNAYFAYRDYVNQRSHSKAMESEVPYLVGDIMNARTPSGKKIVSKKVLDAMNEESGFRHQSWSDFETKHLLDTISLVVDLSLNKAKAHTYAKVADLVRLTGETNMMLNMSLIPKGDTGLNEDGTLAFDPVEGMPWETMLELRKQFPDTAGNIAIGINDGQIRNMMKAGVTDHEIDYIIPYHPSGMPFEIRVEIGTGKWADYTESQNERVKAGGRRTYKGSSENPALREWFDIDEGLSDEWKDRPYEYMDYCAQRYLDLCEGRNLTPKFEQFAGESGYWMMLVDRKMIAQEATAENGDVRPAHLIRQLPVVPKFNKAVMLDIMEREVNSGRMQEQQEAIRRTVNAVLSGELSLSEEMDQLIKRFANDQYEITNEIQESDIADQMAEMTNAAGIADQAAQASYMERAINRRLAEATRNDESYELGRYMEESFLGAQAREMANEKVRSGEWAAQQAEAETEATNEQPAEKQPTRLQKTMGAEHYSTRSNNVVADAKRSAFAKQRGQQAIQRPVTIAKDLARKLGVPLHRNLRQRGGNGAVMIHGAYTPALRSIEVRGVDTGELAVTMHELGHHLQDRLNMTSTQRMMQEYGETNPEAFAEFFATYMFDRDSAIQHAGTDFVDDFESRMRGDGCYTDVAQAAAAVREWAAADAMETLQADLTTHAQAERNARRNAKHQMFRRMMTWLNASYAFRNADYRAADNRGQIIRDGERVLSSGEQYQLSQHIPKMATTILRDHLVDINSNVIDNRSVADIMARNGINNDNHDAFAAYLYAQHALDRAAVGKEVWTDEIKSPDAARTAVDNAPANFRAAANEYYDLMHKFRQAWMVDTGLITQQQMDEWEANYPHYIPMYADLSDFAEDFGLGAQFGGTGFGDEWHFHEAHASSAPRITFWESMPDLINSVVRRAARNSVAQALYYEVRDNGEALRDVAHISRVHEITQGNNGQSVESPASAPNAVEVLLPGGQRATIEVTDGLLLDVLNSHGSHGAMVPLLKVFKRMTRLMSSLTTSRNPIFAATNFLRDTMGALTYGATADGSVTGGAFTVIDQMLNALRAGFHYATNTGESASYRNMGGGGEIYIGSTSEQEARRTKQALIPGYNEGALDQARNVVQGAVDFVTMQIPAEISEQSTRLAQYERSLKHYTDLYGDTNYSRARAFLDSQQATVDFAQGGYTEGYQKLRAFVQFMNPTFQGAFQNLEMIHDAFARKGVTAEQRHVAQVRLARTIITYGLMAASQMAVKKFFMDDEERESYETTAEDIRNSYIMLPSRLLGGKERTFIRIPIGQGGINALIFGGMLKGAARLDNEMDISFQKVILGALGELSPVDFTQGVTIDGQGRTRFNLRNELAGVANSTIFGPLISLAANRNYYGNEIVPSYMDEYPAYMQRYNTTPDVFVELSKRTGIPALQLQYLTEQYGGVIGQYVLPMMTKDPATGNWNLSYALDKTWRVARNRFTIEPAYSNDVVQRYDDNHGVLTSINKAYDDGEDLPSVIPSADRDEVKALVDELLTQYKECNKEITALNKQMKEIRGDASIEYGTKQAMLKELTMEQVRYETAWNELYDAFMMQYGYGSLPWNIIMNR